MRVCRRHLVTAFGLRSLAPGDPAYRPRYGGTRAGARRRLSPRAGLGLAAWTLQPRRVSRHTAMQRQRSALLESMRDALEDQGVGTIGEIFDGDPPHHPRGAPAQAWSVACTLDAWRLLREAEKQQPGATSDAASH